MTISPWLIYFADLADSITRLFAALVITLFLWGVIYLVLLSNDSHENNCNDKACVQCKKSWGLLKKIFSLAILFLVLAFFIPSTATVYKMIIIPAAINSQVVQKLPDELQQYIDKVLKDKDSK